MVQGLFIPADEMIAPGLRSVEGRDDFEEVLDGWAEATDLPELNATLYVHGNGHALDLPFNRRATYLWWFHEPEAIGRARLVGDAVLLGAVNADGTCTGLPVAIWDRILSRATYNVARKETTDVRWHPSPLDHDDYFEAVVWATLLLEHAPGLEVRIDQVGPAPFNNPPT